MKIYRVEDDFRKPIRWYLQVPCGSDTQDLTWAFNSARRASSAMLLYTELQQNGRKVDFTFAAFDISILNRAAMSVFQTYASECVEFIPTKVEGATEDYFIMNILAEADCLDESVSVIQWWQDEDGRPDRIGTYRMLAREIYDCNITKLPAIFRLSKFSVRIIVTGKLQKAIEDAGLTGLILSEIGGNCVASYDGSSVKG